MLLGFGIFHVFRQMALPCLWMRGTAVCKSLARRLQKSENKEKEIKV